jgi:hypothetical protein
MKESNIERLKRKIKEINEFYKQILDLETELIKYPNDIELVRKIEVSKNMYQSLVAHYLAHCEFLVKNKLIDADLAEKICGTLTVKTDY